MNQSEYERRRRHLETEMEAAIDLVRAAYRTQFRALDLVWMNSPENDGAVALVYDPPLPPRPVALLPALPGPAPAPPPKATKRRSPAELYNQVFDLLPALPEVFDRSHVLALLDPKPKRSSLYQALEELRLAGEIERVRSGSGIQPSQYRLRNADSSETEAG